MKKTFLILVLLLPSLLPASNFHIFTGPYLPDMQTTSPYISYQDLYGKRGSYLTLIHYDYSLIKNYGEFSLLLELGFFMDKGRALIKSEYGYIPSGDSLVLYLFPLNLGSIYYFHYLDSQLFVPFVEAGGCYWYFNEKKEGEVTAEGAKRGYFYGGGLKFLMDILEPSAATSLRVDYGIEHTYIIGGYRVYNVRKPSGFDFSETSWYAGLSFNF